MVVTHPLEVLVRLGGGGGRSPVAAKVHPTYLRLDFLQLGHGFHHPDTALAAVAADRL